MSRALAELCNDLGYSFSDTGLLQVAVTHRSASSTNNERLEFLGDAVLGYVIAEWLYQDFPSANEGELSRLRANLVKKETLAELARSIDLGEYLRMGGGELKSGGFRRDSILADAMEAILGAIIMDAGFETCQQTIRTLLASRFQSMPSADDLKDSKTRLQEYLQSHKLELPEYRVSQVSGKSHNQHFVVECRVDSVQRACKGEGRSRRIAEQAAARQMLSALQADG